MERTIQPRHKRRAEVSQDDGVGTRVKISTQKEQLPQRSCGGSNLIYSGPGSSCFTELTDRKERISESQKYNFKARKKKKKTQVLACI